MLENFSPLRDSSKMKFFAIFAAALAFAPALFSAEAVKIDGKYYLEDSGGNLIRLPEGAVSEAPRRRPARSGKYGLPHPSSWHSAPRSEAEAKPKAPSEGACREADGESARAPQPQAHGIALRMCVPSSKSAAERGRFCTGSDFSFRSRRKWRRAERSRRAGKPRWFSRYQGLKTN